MQWIKIINYFDKDNERKKERKKEKENRIVKSFGGMESTINNNLAKYIGNYTIQGLTNER
jgi:hypothetical protein